MACQIVYNDNNTVTVNAPNGEESILFKKIQTLPEIDNDYQALESWLKIYTKTFKDWYGVNWEDISAKKRDQMIADGYLDQNGEPTIFYRGDYAGAESFNYSSKIGKFGQGIYLANNRNQAESFADKVNKKVYPVFLRPGKSVKFKNVLEFTKAVAEFSKVETVPTKEHVKAYVEHMHGEGINIVGEGVMGVEYNIHSKNNVKSIFSKGFEVSGLLFDNSRAVDQFMTKSYQESRTSDKMVLEFMHRLSRNLGMTEADMEIITEDDAALITAKAKNPWSGQPAFFFNGKAYFVRGKLSHSTAFHEFAHPLIKALSKENPGLFNKIFEDILETSQGKEFLAEAMEEYPELEGSHDQIKEEVIVKAMTKVAETENMLDPEAQPSNLLMKAIKKLLYAIKQLFRKMQKGTSVKHLGPSTTVKDLSEMLINSKWDINLDIVTDEDIVAYISQLSNHMRELRKASESKEGRAAVYQLLKENAIVARKQLAELQRLAETDPQAAEDLAIALSDPTGQSTFEQMQDRVGSLLSVKGAIQREATNRRNELEEFEKRIEALSLNLTIIEDTVNRMKDHMADLVDEPNQKKALRQVAYYVENLDQWDVYLGEFLKMADNAGIKANTQVIKDVSAIRSNINSGQAIVKSIYKNALSEVFTAEMETHNENLLKEKNRIIKFYKAKLEKRSNKDDAASRGLKKRIAEAEAQIEEMYIDKKAMGEWLTGMRGDIGWLHSNFENFISNQDPSISSFAKYIKSNMSDVQNKVHNKYSEFVNRLEPLLQEFGIKPSQLKKFAKQITFEDVSYKKDAEGNIVPFKVKTFFNEYQNYKYSLAKIQEAVDEADLVWQSSQEPADFEKLARMKSIQDEHIKFFFRKEFVDEFYHADEIIDTNPLGPEAREDVESILSEIRVWQSTHQDASDIYEDYEVVEDLWRQYKQQFSRYDEFGNLKDEKGLAKAELLQAWRDGKRKFFEYKINYGAFEATLRAFEVKLRAKLEQEEFIPDTDDFNEEFNRRRNLWVEHNTTAKIKDAFYVKREEILSAIQEIMSNVQTGVNFDKEWETILDSLMGRRDNNNQPMGTELTAEHLGMIKDIQQKMEAAKQDVAGLSGLSPNEWAELEFFQERIDEGSITPDELKEYRQLMAKKSKAKKQVPAATRKRLTRLFQKLEALQERKATDYYIDIVNEYYEAIQKKQDPEQKPTEVTYENVKMFESPSFIEPILAKDGKFKEWFEANHILKTKYSKETQSVEPYYERIYAWSVVVPKDKSYYESTELHNQDGSFAGTIQGLPNMKYQDRLVKEEYHSESWKDFQGHQQPKNLQEMEAVKAKYGDQLDAHNQRVKEVLGQGITWDHYINREFYNIDENSGRGKVLKALKDFHLEGQNGLTKNAKLGYELPRFRKDFYQYMTDAGKLKEKGLDTMKEWWTGFTAFMGKRADDQQKGLNFDQQMSYVHVDIYGADKAKVPIRGKYLLDADQVSDDITTSMFMYYQSAENNKKLVEMQPIARAMKDLAQDNPVDLEKINKEAWITRKSKEYIRPKGQDKNNRRKVIEGMVEMVFEGKKLKEGHNNATVIKIVNNMLGMASHSFFAFDVTSAMKNFLGAQWQIALEGAGNKYYSYRAWQRGRPWAFAAMSEISMQITKTGAKSKHVQMIDLFDAIQGRFEEKFGESPGRSYLRDTINMSWTTSHRKWLETEATLQLFSAIMHDTKLEQTLPDGTKKTIRYIHAWELDPETKQIRLKDGIDKTWDIGGRKFNDIKFKNHEVSNLLQGAYAGFDQPLVTRHMAFRMVSSMKKYFTKMLLHRYGARGIGLAPWTWVNAKERFNLGTGHTHLGFYMQNMVTLRRLIDSRFTHIMYLSKDEVRALKLGALEILKLKAFVLLYMWFFSWDPDDKDKWKKLKKRSGALPSIFTDEEWSENWNMHGWLMNHGLLMAMNAEAEYEHFIPSPTHGLNDMYNVIAGDVSLSAVGSLNLLKNMISSLWLGAMGHEEAFYKTDRAGALNVMQAGENKFWVDFYKGLGMKNKYVDPNTAIKNYHTTRKNYRR